MTNLDGLEASLERTLEDLRNYKNLIDQVLELKDKARNLIEYGNEEDSRMWCNSCDHPIHGELDGHKEGCAAKAILEVNL